MRQVTFRGTGQLNGPVIINKTIEVDIKTAQSLTGLKRDDVTSAILAIHYPGVKINPKQIGYEIKDIIEPKTTRNQNSNSKQTTNQYKQQKKSFSFSNIILWILFFPFKLVWWVLKNIWKDDHLSKRKWDKFN
nr:hypothetical protein [uncultured Flavobacterium sp.]